MDSIIISNSKKMLEYKNKQMFESFLADKYTQNPVRIYRKDFRSGFSGRTSDGEIVCINNE